MFQLLSFASSLHGLKKYAVVSLEDSEISQTQLYNKAMGTKLTGVQIREIA